MSRKPPKPEAPFSVPYIAAYARRDRLAVLDLNDGLLQQVGDTACRERLGAEAEHLQKPPVVLDDALVETDDDQAVLRCVERGLAERNALVDRKTPGIRAG